MALQISKVLKILNPKKINNHNVMDDAIKYS